MKLYDKLVQLTPLAHIHIHECILNNYSTNARWYELLDSGRGAKHRVGYHKLISNKREWNNCFIKYQTLDKNISNYIFYRLEFLAILWTKFSVIIMLISIFGQTTVCKIYTLSREPIRLPEIQYPVFDIQ